MQDNSVRLAGCLQRQLAALRHGLLGIKHQIEQCLFEHFPVQQYRRQIGRQIGLDFDPGLARRGREEVDQFLNDCNQISRSQLELLGAGKSQEIVGNLDQPLALTLQALDALQGAALALRLRFLKVLGQELKVQPERAEMVLDFVDKATGQLSELGVAGR